MTTDTVEQNKFPIIVGGYKESTLTLKEIKHPTGKKEEKFYIEGLAIPFNECSSNGVLYTKKSLIETLPQWIGLPLMYNHLIEGVMYPVGKIVEMKEGQVDGKNGLVYKAEVDPQETVLCNKIKNGYLNKVSIHILPEAVSAQDGYQEAIVKRPLELSIVPVPGFAETNMAAYMEKFGDNMKTKKESQENEVVDNQEETNNQEPAKEENQEKSNIDDKLAEIEKESEDVKEAVEEIKEALRQLSKKEGQKNIDLSNKYTTKEQFNKALSLIEELIEGEETEEPATLPADVEVTLNDVADVLQALTNRLDRMEELMKKLVEEPEEEMEEMEEIEDEDQSEEMDNNNQIMDDKDLAMERIKKATKKETIKVVLSDLFK